MGGGTARVQSRAGVQDSLGASAHGLGGGGMVPEAGRRLGLSVCSSVRAVLNPLVWWPAELGEVGGRRG